MIPKINLEYNLRKQGDREKLLHQKVVVESSGQNRQAVNIGELIGILPIKGGNYQFLILGSTLRTYVPATEITSIRLHDIADPLQASYDPKTHMFVLRSRAA
jgi:hypothetical protein